VDIGSSTSKCVILGDGDSCLATVVVPVGAGTSGPARAMSAALAQAGIGLSDLSCICATGYGRNSLELASFEMSELTCHARGARKLFPYVRTLLDVGGQDVKAMRIGSDGRLVNFVVNDKCAAGTGRFLEVMARVLEVDIGELGALGVRAKSPVAISSTCTVFAESEVISHLSAGAGIHDIIAGIHRSVASRAIGLVRRVGVEGSLVMTGGVAQNSGVVDCLRRDLGVDIDVSPLAQVAGALGAALLAYEHNRSTT
jgi:predicted CoA-substrate-specific enzyme activase